MNTRSIVIKWSALLLLGLLATSSSTVFAEVPPVEVCVSTSGRIVYVLEDGDACRRGYETVALSVQGPPGEGGIDAPDRTLDICLLYSGLPSLLVPAPDYCPAPTYAIGDTGPGGGIVFHVTDGGLHGLEAAPADQSSRIVWCDMFTNIAGVDNAPEGTPDSHSGAHNTPLIAAVCGPSSAAGIAANFDLNYATDWFLPNKEELALLYDQREVVGIDVPSAYWSSTESDFQDDFVYFQQFRDDILHNQLRKDEVLVRVRAVRTF